MRTLTKFMRKIWMAVIILIAVTIFNPVVVTRANEYSLIIQLSLIHISRKMPRITGISRIRTWCRWS